jgi:hypothetical protein
VFVSDPIGDPGLALLYRYWRGKKRGDLLPRRADIDPTELPGTLWPSLMLLDVVGAPGAIRFRYRLVGTAFTHAFARDPTHEFVDEALPTRSGYRDFIVNMYLELVRIRKPIYSENLYALDGQPMPMVTKRLSLPLSSDGAAVDMAMAAHAYEYDQRPLEGYLSLSTAFQEIKRVILDG